MFNVYQHCKAIKTIGHSLRSIPTNWLLGFTVLQSSLEPGGHPSTNWGRRALTSAHKPLAILDRYRKPHSQIIGECRFNDCIGDEIPSFYALINMRYCCLNCWSFLVLGQHSTVCESMNFAFLRIILNVIRVSWVLFFQIESIRQRYAATWEHCCLIGGYFFCILWRHVCGSSALVLPVHQEQLPSIDCQ